MSPNYRSPKRPRPRYDSPRDLVHHDAFTDAAERVFGSVQSADEKLDGFLLYLARAWLPACPVLVDAPYGLVVCAEVELDRIHLFDLVVFDVGPGEVVLWPFELVLPPPEVV